MFEEIFLVGNVKGIFGEAVVREKRFCNKWND